MTMINKWLWYNWLSLILTNWYNAHWLLSSLKLMSGFTRSFYGYTALFYFTYVHHYPLKYGLCGIELTTFWYREFSFITRICLMEKDFYGCSISFGAWHYIHKISQVASGCVRHHCVIDTKWFSAVHSTKITEPIFILSLQFLQHE